MMSADSHESVSLTEVREASAREDFAAAAAERFAASDLEPDATRSLFGSIGTSGRSGVARRHHR